MLTTLNGVMWLTSRSPGFLFSFSLIAVNVKNHVNQCHCSKNVLTLKSYSIGRGNFLLVNLSMFYNLLAAFGCYTLPRSQSNSGTFGVYQI